jgi:hypothetical protein
MCCHLDGNERPSRRPRRTSVYEVRHLRMFRPGESQWWHWSAADGLVLVGVIVPSAR